jgi:hypothetical protein
MPELPAWHHEASSGVHLKQTTFISSMSERAIGVVVIGALMGGLAYLQFASDGKPITPPAFPAVSNCKELRPGMRRIGERQGFQFDLPIRDLTITEGWGDTPAAEHVFDIKLNNSKAHLMLSSGSSIPLIPPDPILASAGQERKILDKRGNMIGEDSWGHWGQGERWRHVRFRESGLVDASYGSKNEAEIPSYGSVHERDAAIFDQIIDSACRELE